MPIVIVAIAIAAIALAWPKLVAERRRTDIANACRQLQARLATTRVQGGDQNEAARLEAELRLCIADAQAAGESIDVSLVTLETARAQQQQIDQEWGHYRSTDYADSIKRNMTRGTILRVGGELVETLRLAAQQAESVGALDQVRALAIEVARKSFDRASCYDAGASGCSRMGVNEPAWHARTLDEYTRILLPLVGVGPDLPDERRAVWLRVRPLWETIGVSPEHSPRVAKRGHEYGGITAEQVPGLRAAGSNPVLGLIDARRAQLGPRFIGLNPAIARRVRLDPKLLANALKAGGK